MTQHDHDLRQELETARRDLAERDAELAALRAERAKPMRLKQAAAALGVSEITARRMAKRGLAKKPGGQWLFDPAVVAAIRISPPKRDG